MYFNDLSSVHLVIFLIFTYNNILIKNYQADLYYSEVETNNCVRFFVKGVHIINKYNK